MLKHLSIRNYALISELSLDLPEGFTVITGETGAGKSILLGALGLILGERADSKTLKDPHSKCIVEGSFDISAYPLKDFFTANELDHSGETVIRREITPEGKSRAFINDTPVTLQQLKELGSVLVDIHSQHETLLLNNPLFQLSVVDAYASHRKQLDEYRVCFYNYTALRKELEDISGKEAAARQEQDYLQFQFNELEEAGLKEGEQKEIEEELETLNNAEEIKSSAGAVSGGLSGEGSLVQQLAVLKGKLNGIAKYNTGIKELLARLDSSYIELKDIASELEALEESISFDPQRAEELSARLDLIYRLQKKHRADTIKGLLDIRAELSGKLNQIATFSERIAELNKQLTAHQTELLQRARVISRNRERVIPQIEKKVREILSGLGMPNANLKVSSERDENNPGPHGIDRITFLFSANKGSEFRELSKVASGGELSRLMLAVKSIVARLMKLPTIIFDEIDSGVGGEVAGKMARILHDMAEDMQVVTITHLPQIAGMGSAHFMAYKEVSGKSTSSRLKMLNKDERVLEIAKMLSSALPTPAAIRNAKELLKA